MKNRGEGELGGEKRGIRSWGGKGVRKASWVPTCSFDRDLVLRSLSGKKNLKKGAEATEALKPQTERTPLLA